MFSTAGGRTVRVRMRCAGSQNWVFIRRVRWCLFFLSCLSATVSYPHCNDVDGGEGETETERRWNTILILISPSSTSSSVFLFQIFKSKRYERRLRNRLAFLFLLETGAVLWGFCTRSKPKERLSSSILLFNELSSSILFTHDCLFMNNRQY